MFYRISRYVSTGGKFVHEYSLMQDVIHSIVTRLEEDGINKPGTVKEVRLRIGALDIHSKESFEQAFYVQAKDTVLSDAKLDLQIVPGHIRCKCGYEGDVGGDQADGHDPQPAVECPNCGELCLVEGGRGIEPIDIAVADEND